MKKIKSIIPFIKSKINFKRKRTWFILVFIVIFLIIFIFSPSQNSKNVVSDFVKYIDLKQTVLATGQVTSETDLKLSFNSSGIVKSINVKVGEKVKAGQILASLDQVSELASLSSARGALAGANARLKRIIEGASNEEITLAQVALDNAKRDYENIKIAQETLVENAYHNLLNSTPEAVPEDGTSDYTAPIISGTYNLGKEGIIKLRLYYSSGGISFSASGLTEGIGVNNEITAQPIGNSGLYIKFSSASEMNERDWVIEIPNKKASNYLTNYNAYQSAIKTQNSTLSSALSIIKQREAELALRTATARNSDIELAQADVLSASGQVGMAQAKYNNTIITAPVDGTITSIDIKIGELAQLMKEVIVLQDVSNVYLEANINEANIANLSLGLPIDISFDAFGSDKIFNGFITKIDPSSTIISGVVNYKITASVEQVSNLRPGMTANMTIKAKEKNHVLVVPSRSILTAKDGTQSLRIITNKKNKKYKEVKITTGLEGDNGMVEVLSGVSDGDEFVVLIKAK